MHSDTPSTEPSSHNWRDRIVLWFGRGFGSGQIPFAPGTFGTLAGLPLVWILQEVLTKSPAPHIFYWVITILIFILGIPTCKRCEQLLQKHDPGEIVIDEIAAILVIFGAVDFTWTTAIAGFVLFRLFDIFKPWPVSWADKRNDAIGIMLDDLLAAIYTLLFLLPLNWYVFI